MVVQLLVTHDMIPNLKEKFGDGMGHMRLAEASEVFKGNDWTLGVYGYQTGVDDPVGSP